MHSLMHFVQRVHKNSEREVASSCIPRCSLHDQRKMGYNDELYEYVFKTHVYDMLCAFSSFLNQLMNCRGY
jgi:hypothetical protein